VEFLASAPSVNCVLNTIPNLMLVTRNANDFEAIDGLPVINPWQLH
jgi:hypothetical protein